MATNTNRYETTLAFDVQGTDKLAQLVPLLNSLEGEIGQLASKARSAITSGTPGGNPADLTAGFRSQFGQIEAATREFDRSRAQATANTQRGYQAITKDVELLTERLQRLNTLQSSSFTGKSFEGFPAGTNVYQLPGLAGTVQRSSAGGYIPVSATGQVLSDPFRTRPQAAEALRKSEIASLVGELERRIPQVLGNALGSLAGVQEVRSSLPPPAGPPPAAVPAAEDPFNQRVKRVTDTLERAGASVQTTFRDADTAVVSWTNRLKTATGEVVVPRTGQVNYGATQPSEISRTEAGQLKAAIIEANKSVLSQVRAELEQVLSRQGLRNVETTGLLSVRDLSNLSAQARAALFPGGAPDVTGRRQVPVPGLIGTEAGLAAAQSLTSRGTPTSTLEQIRTRLASQEQTRAEQAAVAEQARIAASQRAARATETLAGATTGLTSAEERAAAEMDRQRYSYPEGLSSRLKFDRATGQVSGALPLFGQEGSQAAQYEQARVQAKARENLLTQAAREEAQLLADRARYQATQANPEASQLDISKTARALYEQSLPELTGRLRAMTGDAAKADELLVLIGKELQKAASPARSVATQMESWSDQIRRNERILAAANARGPLQRFGAEFTEGFIGARGLSLPFQIGQTAKFSLLYGTAYQALYAFQQGLQASVQQAIAFQNALIELSIATQQTTAEVTPLADRLGQSATQYGLAPDQGVTAGIRAIGVFQLNNEPTNVRDFQATQFSKAVAQLNFVTSRDVESITSDLGSIAQAFNLSASQVTQIQDFDAYFSKQLGSALGGTLQTVAQIGSIAKDAGFSLPETQALAAQLQSRTGQTPEAVAGLLSQFFGRAGDPALAAKLGQLGVDTSQGFRQQIEQLSQLNLTQRQLLFIENAFGRGRSGQAASVIIQSFPNVEQLAARAQTEAPGTAEKAIAERLDSAGGQIKILVGNLRQLAADIGRSGLLSVIAAGAKALDVLVVALDRVLQLWNQMPAVVRDLVGAFVLLKTATVVLAATERGAAALQAGSNLLGAIPGLGAARTAYSTTRALQTGGVAAGQIEGQLAFDGLAASGGRVAAARAGLGAGVAELTGAAGFSAATLGIGAAVTGVVLAGTALADDFKSISAASKDATASLSGIADATDTASLQAAVESIRTQAKALRESPSLLSRAVSFGQVSTNVDAQAAGLERWANFFDQVAQDQDAAEKLAAAQKQLSVFGDPAAATVDDLTAGLTSLDQVGTNASDEVRLLNQELRTMGRGARGAAARVNADKTAQQLTASIFTGLSKPDQDLYNSLTTTTRIPGPAGGPPQVSTVPLKNVLPYEDFVKGINEQLDPEKVQADIAAFIKKTGRQPTYKDLNKIIAQEILSINFPELLSQGTNPRLSPFVDTAAIKKFLRDTTLNSLDTYIKNTDPSRIFKQSEVTALLSQVVTPRYDAELSRLNDLGFGSGTRRFTQAIRRQLASLNLLSSRSEDTGALKDEIAKRQSLLAQSIIARLEGEREVAQAAAKGDQKIKEIGRDFLTRELKVALKAGDLSVIKSVIASGDQTIINSVRRWAQNALRQAQALAAAEAKVSQALAAAGQLIQYTITQAGDLIAHGGYNAAPSNQRDVEAYQQILANLQSALSTTVPTGSGLTGPSGSSGGGGASGPTAAQIAAAKAQAEAARKGGQIAPATAALQAAKADLAAATKGTQEYYQALGQVYEAQRQLAEAISAYKINQFLIANDITDPVIQARAEVKKARQKLRYDQNNGAGKDQLLQDRLDLETAQNNRQAAAFQQWFSDLQTNEQLNRITDAQYIRILERRRERLLAIKNRTRQEQDELNQIDQALQSARDTMSGQFNLGDINVPTPYQVRRFIEESVKKTVTDPLKTETKQPFLNDGGRNTAGLFQQALQDAKDGKPGKFENLGQPLQVSHQNVHINIDGADVGKIRQVLTDILGHRGIRTTSTATSKR